MGLTCYMAMTSAEFTSAEKIPNHPAWMSCHFSSRGTGLSNLPQDFPEGGMIILDDSTPFCDHQPEKILQQLNELCGQLKPGCVLLDFQRPDVPQTQKLSQLLCQKLPCPAAVSHLYAQKIRCPVLLPPPPMDIPLKEYIADWTEREIWLELAPDTARITVTEDGTQVVHGVPIDLQEPVFVSQELACKYHIQLLDNQVIFHLQRDLCLLETQAETLGIARLVGLYQQLN